MTIPTSLPRLKGFCFPREIIAYAVWAYHRFALSTADVEDLLAERGAIFSREAVRLWVNRFRVSVRDLHPTRPAPAAREMAYGRSGRPDQRRETLAVACNRRQWRCTRHSDPASPQSVSSADWFQPMANRVS